jgi:hypothetical protein
MPVILDLSFQRKKEEFDRNSVEIVFEKGGKELFRFTVEHPVRSGGFVYLGYGSFVYLHKIKPSIWKKMLQVGRMNLRTGRMYVEIDQL